MKIVIDIDDEDRKDICNIHFVRESLKFKVGKAIMNGTPLPKGHGRLIDADAISLDDIGFFSISDYQKMVHKLTTSCSTIIEADGGDAE